MKFNRDVIVVEIDPLSIIYFGGYPFERKKYLEIVNEINKFCPSVIYILSFGFL